MMYNTLKRLFHATECRHPEWGNRTLWQDVEEPNLYHGRVLGYKIRDIESEFCQECGKEKETVIRTRWVKVEPDEVKTISETRHAR